MALSWLWNGDCLDSPIPEREAMAGKRHFDITVLVLDPNRVRRARIGRELRRSGIGAAREASDPVEAIEVMRTTRIDVLVTDQRPELVRFLRASRTRRISELPVVMIGARLRKADVREALDAGVDEFVTRDTDSRSLCDSIVQVVRRGRRFVEADDYYGPDRRRRMDGTAETDEPEEDALLTKEEIEALLKR